MLPNILSGAGTGDKLVAPQLDPEPGPECLRSPELESVDECLKALESMLYFRGSTALDVT